MSSPHHALLGSCCAALLVIVPGPVVTKSARAAVTILAGGTTSTSAMSTPLAASTPLDIVSNSTASLAQPPPVPAGPVSGQVGLVFTSETTGYLAAVPRPQTSGYAGGAISELERTINGGLAWQKAWSGRDIVLHWVGTMGTAIVAAGLSTGGPLLVKSFDDGRGWHEVPVTLSLPPLSSAAAEVGGTNADWYWATSALDFINSHVGFAVPDAMFGQDAPSPATILRTTDAGRHWSAVAFPGGSPTGGLDFVSTKRGFATGLRAPTAAGAQPKGCTGQIWRTTDTGASWLPVPGTCVPYLLTSLSFPTSQVGYAGGGNYAKFGEVPQLAVMATADGGRHWAQVFSAPKKPSVPDEGSGGPFGEIHFYDPADGVALAGGCTMGANGPCEGQAWWTDDGGRSWAPEGVVGAQLASAGHQGAWMSGAMQGSTVLWRSYDRGRSWSPVANAANVGLSGLLVASRRLWVGTEAGQFVSGDGGATWHGLPAAARAAEGGTLGGPVVGLGSSGLVVVQTTTNAVWLSTDGGRSGRTVTGTGLGETGISAVSFADNHDALALGWGSCAGVKPVTPPISLPLRPSAVAYTNDGGRSWRHVADLDVAGYGGLAYSRAVAVAAATCSKGIATSTDGGASWSYWSTPAELTGCQSPSADGTTVVLTCPSYSAGTTTLRVLVSTDAARQWSVRKLTGPCSSQVQGVVAGAPGVLWAFGQRSGQVWRSADGGVTWEPFELGLPVAP